MFKVKDRVKINCPKARRPQWQHNEGTIVQILKGNNSILGIETNVHIVRLDNGETQPVEAQYLQVI